MAAIEENVTGAVDRMPPLSTRARRLSLRHVALPACLIVAAQRILLVAVAMVWSGGHLSTMKWDGRYYLDIAQHGYVYPPPVDPVSHGPGAQTLAFFPLLPVFGRWIHAATGLGWSAAVEVTAVGWLPLAAWGIAEVACLVADRRTALFLVSLWAAAPRGLVTILPYTEGAYTALAAWTMVAILRRRWWRAAALCAIAGLTRSSAVVLVACLELAWLRVEWRRLSEVRVLARGLILALLSASGFVAYLGYVAQRTGHWDGYLTVQAAWRMSSGSPLASVARIPSMWRTVGGHWIDYQYSVLVVLLALLLAVATSFARPTRDLAAFTWISTVWVWVANGYFWSKPRFLLPVFTLGLGPARLLARLPPRIALAVVVVVNVAGAVAEADLWVCPLAP